MNENLNSIIEQINLLDEFNKDLLFKFLKKEYSNEFVPKNAFVVGDNYDFWDNEEDDIYDRIYAGRNLDC